jgi:hypothetical protein
MLIANACKEGERVKQEVEMRGAIQQSVQHRHHYCLSILLQLPAEHEHTLATRRCAELLDAWFGLEVCRRSALREDDEHLEAIANLTLHVSQDLQ